jgi:hypothetical protein
MGAYGGSHRVDGGKEENHYGDVAMEESSMASAGGSDPPMAPFNITLERDAIDTSRSNAPEITIPTHLGLGRW